jgi:phosphoribosylaminoimidazole-succinocarboxamide synthase
MTLNKIESPEIIKYNKPFKEWKTKKLYWIQWVNDQIISEETDMVSAWDGSIMEEVPWKWALSTTISSNTFEYLKYLWIETAHIEKHNENETLVEKLDMIPVECVFRFVETWSYTKRQNHIAKNNSDFKANPDGTILPELLIELFYKEDVIDIDGKPISDPLMKLDKEWNPEVDSNWKMTLLYPKTWEVISYNLNENSHVSSNSELIKESSQKLISETKKVANWVKSLNDKVWMSTLDWKVEFWKNEKWETKLWDVIDWDSCRIRIPYTVKGTDWETYLTKEFTTEELKLSWNGKWNEKDYLSTFEQLKVLPDNIGVDRIHVAISLDKQNFREGWTGNELVKKYEELAKLSTQALEIHKKEMENGNNQEMEIKKNKQRLIDILWRQREK